MKIRKAKLADVPRLVQIERATFRPVPFGKKGFTDYIGKRWADCFVRVRDRDEEIVAFLLVSGGAVKVMATDPAHHRQGHARALMARAIDLVRRGGYPAVELHVREGNEGARAFYKALGFRRVRAEGAYEDGEARLLLRLKV